MSAAPIAPDTSKSKKIGKGSYGCILSPALPNVVDGSVVEFPDHVTKLYVDTAKGPEELARGKRGANMFYGLSGSKPGYKYNLYAHPYSVMNLPREVARECYNTVRSKPVRALRMPNLGRDVYYLRNNPDEIKSLRKLYPFVMFKNIVGLFDDFVKFHATGYIHGDIRPANTVINPMTGDIYIIDFDLVMPAAEFVHFYGGGGAHGFGFFNNPPEALIFFLLYPTLPTYKNNLEWINDGRIDEYKAALKDWIFYQKQVNAWQLIGSPITRDAVTNVVNYAKAVFPTTIRNVMLEANDPEYFRAFTEFIFPTMDSFALSFTLLDLLQCVYPELFEADKEHGRKSFIELMVPAKNNLNALSEISAAATLYDGFQGLITTLAAGAKLMFTERARPAAMNAHLQGILADLTTKIHIPAAEPAAIAGAGSARRRKTRRRKN